MTPLYSRLSKLPLHLARCSSARIQLTSSSPALTSVRHYAKPLPPRPIIAEGDIVEAFLKGSGPGGQKINKTSSAVQLKHVPTGMVIKCQETRSRSQNRKIARRILAERIEDLEKGDQSRGALKLERAQKKKASANKKTRRKYRKLAEGEEAQQDSADEFEPGDGEDDAIPGAIQDREGLASAQVATEPRPHADLEPVSKKDEDQGR